MAAIDQERRRLVELELRADRLGVGDEVVGHLMQRHLGDVEAVREDQLQQQVERTLEVAQPDLEAVCWTASGWSRVVTRRTGR